MALLNRNILDDPICHSCTIPCGSDSDCHYGRCSVRCSPPILILISILFLFERYVVAHVSVHLALPRSWILITRSFLPLYASSPLGDSVSRRSANLFLSQCLAVSMRNSDALIFSQVLATLNISNGIPLFHPFQHCFEVFL
jgi:hypothetical protein